jgi:hypothetical protein
VSPLSIDIRDCRHGRPVPAKPGPAVDGGNAQTAVIPRVPNGANWTRKGRSPLSICQNQNLGAPVEPAKRIWICSGGVSRRCWLTLSLIFQCQYRALRRLELTPFHSEGPDRETYFKTGAAEGADQADFFRSAPGSRVGNYRA